MLTKSFNEEPDGIHNVVFPTDCGKTDRVDELVEERSESGECLDDNCALCSHAEGEEFDGVSVSLSC